MRYSDYDLDQLMFYKEYKTLCDMFLALAKDEETKEKLSSILFQGGYKDYCPSGGIGRNNPFIDIERRLSLAYLIVRNPETFDKLVENNIIYFHGTNANALPGIIKYGLNSVDKIKEHGAEIETGEKWSRIQGKRSFVSFTDVLDLAQGYSLLPSDKETELSFPIVFGTTKRHMERENIVSIKSDVQEVGVRNSFPQESLICVLVPSDKVEIVKKIVDPEVMVLATDGVKERFYYANDGYISIDEKRYQKLKAKILEEKEELLGVKKTVFSRTLKKIQDKKDLLVSLIRGEQLDGNRSFK